MRAALHASHLNSLAITRATAYKWLTAGKGADLKTEGLKASLRECQLSSFICVPVCAFLTYDHTQTTWISRQISILESRGGRRFQSVYRSSTIWETKKEFSQTFPSSLAACRHLLCGQSSVFPSAGFNSKRLTLPLLPKSLPFFQWNCCRDCLWGAWQASLWINYTFFFLFHPQTQRQSQTWSRKKQGRKRMGGGNKREVSDSTEWPINMENQFSLSLWEKKSTRPWMTTRENVLGPSYVRIASLNSSTTITQPSQSLLLFYKKCISYNKKFENVWTCKTLLPFMNFSGSHFNILLIAKQMNISETDMPLSYQNESTVSKEFKKF